MAGVPNFAKDGVAKCPTQGGRRLCEPCWNLRHQCCFAGACECICRDPRPRRENQPKPVQETIDVEKIGTTYVGS